MMGRASDLISGKITPGQFLGGVTIGGEKYLSDERMLAKLNAEEKRLQRSKKKDETPAQRKYREARERAKQRELLNLKAEIKRKQLELRRARVEG